MTFATRTALRISLSYLFVAAYWIYFSDVAVAEFLPAHRATSLQTIKGTFFVVVTTFILFGLLPRSISTPLVVVECVHLERLLGEFFRARLGSGRH